MFTELLNKKTIVTDTLYLRFDINAFIEAEKHGINPFELTFPIPLAYIKAGFECCFKSLFTDETVKNIALQEIVKAIPSEKLTALVLAATSDALPPPVIGAGNSNTKPDFVRLRNLFVDIMGRNEEEFYNSTLAEITRRWDDYAIFNGYKSAPQTFTEYDD